MHVSLFPGICSAEIKFESLRTHWHTADNWRCWVLRPKLDLEWWNWTTGPSLASSTGSSRLRSNLRVSLVRISICWSLQIITTTIHLVGQNLLSASCGLRRYPQWRIKSQRASVIYCAATFTVFFRWNVHEPDASIFGY